MQENKNDRRQTEDSGKRVRRGGRLSGGSGPRRLAAALIFIILGAAMAVLIVRLTPTSRKMSGTEYFGTMEDDEAAIVLQDSNISERAVIKDGALYIPYNIVRDELNGRFYWDEENARMLFTTAQQEFEIPVNSTSYSVIDGVLTTDPVSEGSYERTIILRPDDGRITGGNDTGLYVSLDFLQQYTQAEYTWQKSSDHVLIRYQWGDMLTATAKKDAAVRYEGGIKSPVLTQLQKGDSVYVLEQLYSWTEVVTQDGYIGYVKSNRLTEPQTQDITTDLRAQEYPSLTEDSPLTLVWHQISGKDGNSTLSSLTADMTGVDVISPTWFSLADNDGNVTSIASKNYVKKAHRAGLKVWGLVSDFSGDMDTSKVLASTSARRTCIGQLISFAEDLGMDGINLDFEYMEEADALAYVQFVREMSVACRRSGLVFSVDVKPPYDFNAWMNRKEIGTVADYLINMGYDEHYSGSEAGSVASLPYEENAISECIAQGVPAQKIISAVPFYTRIWYSSSGAETTSEVLSMTEVQNTIQSWNLTEGWDSEAFQHYVDWTTGDGVRCRIWIEDADSLAAKVRLVPKYGLGGTACWRLGFENAQIWDTISGSRDMSREEAVAAQDAAAESMASEYSQTEGTEAETGEFSTEDGRES